MAPGKVLLVHLMSNGDCLMATAVARQIKADFPGCHLTWAISHKCKQAIENNPFVDAIWAVEYGPDQSPFGEVWYRTKREAERRRASGEFDDVYYTQTVPDNVGNFDGTTRSTIFRSYPRPITVPVQPTLRLHEHETDRVRSFAERHALRSHSKVVLFECAPSSSQSPLSPQLAVRVASRVLAQHEDAVFVVSSHQSIVPPVRNIIDGSLLTYRENAELSKYCTLLLGCSSGITWLLTSSWAKTIPTIQFLARSPVWYAFASLRYDHQFFGLDASHVFETDITGEAEMADLVSTYLAQESFDGLPGFTFVPSIEQILDIRERFGAQAPLRRILGNFAERNRDVEVDKTALYAALAQVLLRRRARAVARRLRASARRARSLLGS